MKKVIITLLIGAFVLHSVASAQPYVIPPKAKRILFLGNSITYGGAYVAYIDAYLTLKYPNRQFEIINVGLPSETVSGLSEQGHAGGKFPRPALQERLARVLKATQPDVVFACYGMNDGIYLPFDDTRFNKFREGITWLHQEVSKQGATIMLVTPPVFDERKGKAYANVLDIYSEWMVSLRYTANWNVIDMHGPLKRYLDNRREVDSAFSYAVDGVHPDDFGHFKMAQQILVSLGEKEVGKANSIAEALQPFAQGAAVLKLVEQKHRILKDAWLSHTGHKRPGMNVGLPLQEAQSKALLIQQQINALLKK